MSNPKTERRDRSRLIALMLIGARVKQFFWPMRWRGIGIRIHILEGVNS